MAVYRWCHRFLQTGSARAFNLYCRSFRSLRNISKLHDSTKSNLGSLDNRVGPLCIPSNGFASPRRVAPIQYPRTQRGKESGDRNDKFGESGDVKSAGTDNSVGIKNSRGTMISADMGAGEVGGDPKDTNNAGGKTTFSRISDYLKKNKLRIGGLFLGATALTTSTRLWGEQLRYEHDMRERNDRIQMLTEELQGRFDMEYDSLDSLKVERENILRIVDQFAADWPPSEPLDPRRAQKRIAELRTKIQDWFAAKEAKLVPDSTDPFLKERAEDGRGPGFTGLV